MRIVFVLDEIAFFHPQFLHRVLERCTDTVVGAAVVTKVSDRSNIDTYLKRHWYYLKFSEMFKLASRKFGLVLRDKLPVRRNGTFYSVRSVLKHWNIDYIEVEYDINQSRHLNWIEKKDPDVIVSSNSLIFKERLLDLPRICCINRHSALLPSYGGLWPVFQAYRSGEPRTGASVHVMTKKIDAGAVLAQKATPIRSGQPLYDLYDKCFDLSVEVVIEALEKVKKNDFVPVSNGNNASYFSFPTKDHCKDFRRRNGRFA